MTNIDPVQAGPASQTPSAPQQGSTAPQSLEIPEEFSNEDMSEFLHMAAGKEQKPAPDQAAPPEDKQPPADPQASGDVDEDVDATPAKPSINLTQEQLVQMAQSVAQATAAANRAPAQGAPGQQDQVVAELMQANPGLDEEGAKFMVRAVTPLLQRQTAALDQKLQVIQQHLVQNQQRQLVETFKHQIFREMDKLKIAEDPEERDDVFDLVVARGMREHGQRFDETRAIQTLRKIANRRKEKSHNQIAATVQKKKDDVAASPPVAHATGGKTVGADVYRALRNPQDKQFDIGKPGFNKLLKGLIHAPKETVDSLMG